MKSACSTSSISSYCQSLCTAPQSVEYYQAIPIYSPANLRLRGVLNPHAHVVELPIEIVLSQVDAPELGRVQDVRHSDAPQVLLLPQGGPVAQHDSGEDLVAVDALSDSLVLREGRRKSWQRSDLEDVKMREQVS